MHALCLLPAMASSKTTCGEIVENPLWTNAGYLFWHARPSCSRHVDCQMCLSALHEAVDKLPEVPAFRLPMVSSG